VSTKLGAIQIIKKAHISNIMRNERVKGSATTFAGYRFQSLYGVQVLADWLSSPSMLTRVRFECDDKAIGPQGLDDIVAERADGRFDYLQVKYTPPEAANGCLLTWDWLLNPDSAAKTPKSFIQKWAKALSAIPAERQGTVALVTNRTPDRDIESSLDGMHLDFERAPSSVQTQLAQQLGSTDAARIFLRTLEVRHSEHGFLRLGSAVKAQLSSMGYPTDGINRLIAKASDWANFKEDPPPDGWITLDVVRGELSRAQPAPIPQDFIVPDGYEPPNLSFHEGVMNDISASKGGVLTLYGPPGRGKSTYISYLAEQLTAKKIPIIRHHYFLSLEDRSGDRLTPAQVGRSLLSQISFVASGRLTGNIDTDRSEGLHRTLEECGAAWAADGMPFVVIMDGLDHVWRDNGKDVRPLDELFQQLLPLPPNVFLLVGTQPVADDQLPAPLVRAAPRSSWRELPPMSGDAVHGYVMKQVRGGRWKLRSSIEESELARCASGLYERTHGHPLHVVYSVEELLSRTPHPSEYDIRELPECPGDDIRNYYRALWQKLSYSQRDVLHLLSALNFRWPAQAFQDMSLGKDPGRLTLEGVRHLLFETGLGLQPFHESLVVFIKEEDEHAERVLVLLPRAEEWLRTRAPERLRNTWHWLVLARLGNSQPLRNGLTRDWVLDRLVDGYAITSLTQMLTVAEEAAFAERNYGEAYRHRALKTRLLNGPEFQVDFPPRLLRAAWAVSSDATLIQDAFVARNQLDTSVLPWLALSLQERGDEARARDTGRYAIDRWNSELRLNPRYGNKESVVARLQLSHAAMKSGASRNPKGLAREFTHMPSWGAARLTDHLREGANLPLIVETWSESKVPNVRRMLEDLACEIALHTGADITAWEEFTEFRHSSFASIVGALKGEPFSSLSIAPASSDVYRSTDMDTQHHMLYQLVRDWFLRSLSILLHTDGDFCWLEAPEFGDRTNLTEYLEALKGFTEEVAAAFRSCAPVPFEAVFEHFNEVPEPTNLSYQQQDTLGDFRRALLRVAVDVHLLSILVGGAHIIEAHSWSAAEKSPWLHTGAFPTFALSYGLRVFSNELILSVVARRAQLAVSELQETCTIAQDLLDLCELLILYGEIDTARYLCRQAWDVTIGYGHRKDPALDEVLSALEHLVDADPGNVRRLLSRVAPQIANVTQYTDGSGTRHIPASATALLAKLDRPALAKQYAELVVNGDWYYAEASMRQLLESSGETTDQLFALANTGLSKEECQRSHDAESPVGKVTSAAMRQQGASVSAPVQTSDASSEEAGRDAMDFAAYPPSAFTKLLEELQPMLSSQADGLCDWFRYWKAKGKASTLAKYVGAAVLAETDRQRRLRHLLDELLDTCVELEGASERTFSVAVKAQMDNGGWFGYFFENSEATKKRLTTVAHLFAHRADEFIVKSAKNWLTTAGNPSELIIPGEMLVFFLVKLGRVAEANAFAQSMVDTVIADTSALVLPKPRWA